MSESSAQHADGATSELPSDSGQEEVVDVPESSSDNQDSDDASNIVNDSDEDEDDAIPDEGADAVEETAEAEEPKAPADPAIVPTLLKDLESGNEEQKNEAVSKLALLSYEDPSFASAHLSPLAPELFRILSVLSLPPLTDTSGAIKVSFLELICGLFSLTPESRALLALHVNAIIPYLISSESLDRYYVLNALELLADEDPSTHEAIIASLTTHIYGPAPTPPTILAGIEIYENAFIYGRDHCMQLLTKAGAYDLTLQALHSPDSKTRLAVLSCFTQLYPHVQAQTLDTPSSSPSPTTLAITCAVIQRLSDDSGEVVLEATNFLHGTASEDEVRTGFTEDSKALHALVLSLAHKPPGTVGTGPDWLLNKLGEGNENVFIKEAFKATWTDEAVPLEAKLKSLSGLKDTFMDIRTAALEGGMCDMLLGAVKNGGEQCTSALTVLDKLMEEDQTVGYHLLHRDPIAPLLDVAEGSSPTDPPLALSVLARLLDSYTPSRDAQRDNVATALMAPTILPRILALFHSPSPASAGAANLLAAILLEESGTESWSYDPSKPPPPTPRKDALITPSLVAYTLSLILKQTAAKEAALYLLCQFCWGYQRGFDLVKTELERLVPDADVLFFPALCGYYSSRHAGRQRRRLGEAAYLAGALPRAFELLAQEEGSDAPRRQAAVEGLRVILCADSADLEEGRKSEVLPRVLASLLADQTKASLDPVAYTLRLLARDEDQSWLLGWSAFGTEKTVEHLVGLLHLVPYNLDPEAKLAPDQERDKLDDEAFEKATKEYTAKVGASQNMCTSITKLVLECINKSLPAIAPHSSPLISPLVLRSREMEDEYEVLETLTKLLSFCPQDSEPLVAAFKHQLALPTPPSLNSIATWVVYSPALAAGLREAGLGPWLLVITSLEDEEDERFYYRRQALTIYASLVEQHTNDEAHALTLRELFFTTDKAVQIALANAANPDDVFDAMQAMSALGMLAKGHPEGIKRLQESGALLDRALKIFDDPEYFCDATVAILAHICTPGEPKLTELLRSYIDKLTPPPAEQVSEEPEGKKKGKKGKKGKGKKYTPRMSELELWTRFALLSTASPAVRQCVIDAGAIPAAATLINSTVPAKWEVPLKTLTTLVAADPIPAQAVSESLLPRIAELFLKDGAPYSQLLYVVRAFLPAHVVELVLPSGAILSLLRAMGEFPSSFDDQSELVGVLHTLAQSDVARPVLTHQLGELLGAEDVEKHEATWGYIYALRRLLEAPEVGPGFVVDAGGVEFTLARLRSEQISVVAAAANLAAYLALLRIPSVLPALLEGGAVKLVEDARTKALALAARTALPKSLEEDVEEVDPDEAAAQLTAECEANKAFAEKLAKALAVLRGETEEFDADYY
ncbi:armadillo-type protein [Lyophyllum atratum]|nr:armadillo-type protein [Lyophyllum atratum]